MWYMAKMVVQYSGKKRWMLTNSGDIICNTLGKQSKPPYIIN